MDVALERLDRLSTLPDSLLCLILSKLSFRNVVQCSVLSKRWRFLYREMPNLVLCPYLLTPPRLQPPTPDPHSMATVENIISNILQSHSSDLMTVSLTNDTAPWTPTPTPVYSIPWQFTPQSVSNWLQCISRKNVKMLILRDSTARESPVPEALFSCSRLTQLKLYNYILTRIPTQIAGFKHLLICTFVSIELTDDSLAIFISQCPLLLKLRLKECVGLRRPVISALKITHLNLSVHGMEVLNVNCPKLQKFKNSKQVKELRVNEVSFHELSPAIKTLEMNGGNNLTALWLGLCSREGEYICSANRFLQIMGSLKSLKALDICFCSLLGRRRVAVPILNLLGRLPNLEHFGLMGPSLILEEELQRNPMPSYLSAPVANLQSLDINISQYDETEIGFLRCLLQRSPNLTIFTFVFPVENEGKPSKWFREKWAHLKEAHLQGKIPEKICEFIFYI